MGPCSRGRIKFHDPEVVASRMCRVDLQHHLGQTIAIDIACNKPTRRIGEARAIEIRLQGMSRNRREMNPIECAGFKLHDPKVIAAGVSSVDLRNHLGAAVSIDVRDSKSAYRIAESRAIEVCL